MGKGRAAWHSIAGSAREAPVAHTGAAPRCLEVRQSQDKGCFPNASPPASTRSGAGRGAGSKFPAHLLQWLRQQLRARPDAPTAANK